MTEQKEDRGPERKVFPQAPDAVKAETVLGQVRVPPSHDISPGE